MSYVGTDFSPISAGEIEWLSIDFSRILNTGETIVSAQMQIAQILPPSSVVTSPSASINMTTVSSLVGPLSSGIYYKVTAIINTSLGQVLSSYSNISCQG